MFDLERSINADLLTESIEIADSHRILHPGEIFYLKKISILEDAFKSRPVLVTSMRGAMEHPDLYTAVEITSNYEIPDAIPILLNGKVSFINPTIEYTLSIKDVAKHNFYGTVDPRVMEMIKYRKIRYLTGMKNREFEDAIDRYCIDILHGIENGILTLYRGYVENTSRGGGRFVGDIYLSGKYKEFSNKTSVVIDAPVPVKPTKKSWTQKLSVARKIESDDEIVYKDPNGDEFSKLGDLFVGLNLPEEPMENDGEESDDKPVGNPHTYFLVDGDFMKLKSTSQMSLKEKGEFLEDLEKCGAFGIFASMFNVTGTTIKNRAVKMVDDLNAAGITIPDEVTKFVFKKGKRK